MTIIRDPETGRGAEVDEDAHLKVEAEQSDRTFFISKNNGQVYTVISVDATAVANEETLYLQNTSSTKNLFIRDIAIATDTSSLWRIKFVTGTAARSTLLTPVNLNKTSSNAADVIARGDGAITGLTDDGDIGLLRVLAATTHHHGLLGALVLGQNDDIAIECETNAAVELTVTFHLE